MKMTLKALSILNYKNIRQAEATFSPRMNCFFGNNGMGKTNLLDAIYYLSFCKSHNHTLDSQLITSGEELCLLQGWYEERDEREEEIFCAIRAGQRKQFKRNKKEYDKLSTHIGLIPLVMVSPSDYVLIQGGSDERRRFMDQIISQRDKNYLHALIQYNKALTQRNSLLKEQSGDIALFEVLEMQLEMYGQLVFEKRKELIEQLTPIFNNHYQSISQSSETVCLTYRSQVQEGEIMRVLGSTRDRDRLIGYTSTGIHKDELEMNLGDFLIRKAGSQGQNKTFLIALKLAQYALMKESNDTTPILLLDDIFDKLDATRVEQIIRLVSSDGFGQLFITDTNRKYLDEIVSSLHHDYALFKMEQGELTSLTKRNEA